MRGCCKFAERPVCSQLGSFSLCNKQQVWQLDTAWRLHCIKLMVDLNECWLDEGKTSGRCVHIVLQKLKHFQENNHLLPNATRGQSLNDFTCAPVCLEERALRLCAWLSCQWNQQPGFHTATIPDRAQIMWWDCGNREISFCGRVTEVKITFHGWREEAGGVIQERMV